MRHALKRFFIVLIACASISLLLTVFNGRDLSTLIDLGSYVGALSLLFGAWRMYSSNDALEQAEDLQRQQNLAAAQQGQDPPHKQLLSSSFSTGPLFFGGLVWLVALQTVRYTWHIVL
jgi:hypothetical protein